MNSSFGESPLLHFGLHVLRHARIVGDEIEPALLIGLVLVDDLATALVAGLGIVIVHADVVEAEGPVVVRVGLVIRDRIEFLEGLAPARGEDAQQQLVLLWIVAFGLGKWDAVWLVIRQAHAEAVGLHALVARAVFARRLGADARQHAALRIARHNVRADLFLHGAEVMPVMQHADLHAIPLFAIRRVRFTPDVIAYARRGHEIAFVGRVDEHLSRVGLSAQAS